MILKTGKSSLHLGKLTALISVTVFLAGGLFYWYEFRPAQIKHDCSWEKVVQPAIPERPIKSKDQLIEEGIIGPDCDNVSSLNGFEKFACETRDEAAREKVIESYKSTQPAIPEKVTYEKVFGKAYEFCLHYKGL